MTSQADASTGDMLSVEDITVTQPGIIKRAVGAAAIGNVTEWYDFGIYAYLEGTIGNVFFSGMSGTAQTLLVAGVFAVSFLARPFGGLFFGPLGDRIGRTKVLALTMILMALGTFAIGIIPTSASIGIGAPILLVVCRLIQGFSTGGEYGGAMTFVAEYSPDRRRGGLCSWLEFGTLTGYIMGAIIVTALTFSLSEEQMLSWGWRIPFMIAFPLGAVGLYLRARLEETPAFAKLAEESAGRQHQQTFKEFIKLAASHWRAFLVCIGLVLAFNVTNYMLTTFVPTYLTITLGHAGEASVSETAAQVMQIAVLLLIMLVIVFLGRLSDRIGRRPIVVTGCVFLIALSLPAILLMRSGTIPGVFAGLVLMGMMLVCFNSTMPSTLPALFNTGIRYGTLSIAFNVSVSLFGGTTQTVNESLIAATGDLNWPAYYLMVAGVIGIISIYSTRESNARPLPGSNPSVSSEQEARDIAAGAGSG